MTSVSCACRPLPVRTHGPTGITNIGPSKSTQAALTGSTCPTIATVGEVGLREMRQNASELVRRAEAGEQVTILSAVQRRFDALPIDDAVADSYGRLAARVAKVGRQPRARVMDLLIAATAHAHGATVYTRNAKDLAGLEDLIAITPV